MEYVFCASVCVAHSTILHGKCYFIFNALLTVCMNLKESEHHHSIGSLVDGGHPSPKTDGDHLMKDNLVWYCLKTFEMTNGSTCLVHHTIPASRVLVCACMHIHWSLTACMCVKRIITTSHLVLGMRTPNVGL